jgi:hypothetical protein
MGDIGNADAKLHQVEHESGQRRSGAPLTPPAVQKEAGLFRSQGMDGAGQVRPQESIREATLAAE